MFNIQVDVVPVGDNAKENDKRVAASLKGISLRAALLLFLPTARFGRRAAATDDEEVSMKATVCITERGPSSRDVIEIEDVVCLGIAMVKRLRSSSPRKPRYIHNVSARCDYREASEATMLTISSIGISTSSYRQDSSDNRASGPIASLFLQKAFRKRAIGQRTSHRHGLSSIRCVSRVAKWCRQDDRLNAIMMVVSLGVLWRNDVWV